MGLQKSRGIDGVQQPYLTQMESTYREELVRSYKERLAGKSTDTVDLKKLTLILADQIALSHNLFSLGKDREANTLRKGALDILKSRANACDSVAFSSIALIGEDKKLIEFADKKLSSLTKKKDRLMEIDLEKRKEHDAALVAAQTSAEAGNADPNTAGLGNAVFAAESAQRKQEFMKFMNEEYTPVVQELKKLYEVQKGHISDVNTSIMQAFNLRNGAIAIMMELGNSHGAFELSLDTLRIYYEKGISSVAERLLSSALNLNLQNVGAQKMHGKHENLHELMELGVESALEGAQIIEEAVNSGRSVPDVLVMAVELRKSAASMSVNNGNVDDVDNILVSKSNEYAAVGRDMEAKILTFQAADLFHKLATTAVNNGDAEKANEFADRSASILLAIAEDIENRPFSKVPDQQQAEQPDPLQAPMSQAMPDANLSIFDAVNIRSKVAYMYAELHRFPEIHDMITAAAEKYKNNGQEDARLNILELGAHIASMQAGDIKPLKRDNEEKDYSHLGTYL